jgi:CRISPR-associated protein Csb2
MVRITVSFPLGVYHAQSSSSPAEPEWPPSPLRLVGALLAAAHGRRGGDTAADRALVQRLCDAPPPIIIAPDDAPAGAQRQDDAAPRLRGATRWAPRNHVDARNGISPRNLGRTRSEVGKPGVAIGDRPLHFIWPELTLDDTEMAALTALASDITFLGTTRSPVIAHASATADEGPTTTWQPTDSAVGAVEVRVPDRATIAAFDQREAMRRSDGDRVRPAGLVPQIAIGQRIRYARPGTAAPVEPFDPQWWGEPIVLVVDPARSQLLPKAPAAYLLARAVRVALLGAFGDAGTLGEAPPILTGREGEPHCAFVPLPYVWNDHADGRLFGVAILPPHARRVADVAAQRARVEDGLRALLPIDGGRPRRDVVIPGGGLVRLAEPTALDARKVTLQPVSYSRPSTRWVSVTPVIHSRWRKGGIDGLLRQVTVDCAHVGLPAPERVDLLRGAGKPGGAGRAVPLERVPERWRGPLQGPSDHLAITFARPVNGPVLLGKARHFGLGLLVPEPVSASAARSSRSAA